MSTVIETRVNQANNKVLVVSSNHDTIMSEDELSAWYSALREDLDMPNIWSDEETCSSLVDESDSTDNTENN